MRHGPVAVEGSIVEAFGEAIRLFNLEDVEFGSYHIDVSNLSDEQPFEAEDQDEDDDRLPFEDILHWRRPVE